MVLIAYIFPYVKCVGFGAFVCCCVAFAFVFSDCWVFKWELWSAMFDLISCRRLMLFVCFTCVAYVLAALLGYST